MGIKIWEMGINYLVYFLSINMIIGNASSLVVEETGIVYIDGKECIGRIDEDFVCATLDWWPPEKCDYGKCSWGLTSLLNLDLNNPIFLKAIRAFKPLKLRLGGSLQDKLIYESEETKQSCKPFMNKTSEMFGFTPGCLPMKRWDDLNAFFNKTGAVIIFGLNALAGKTLNSNGTATGAWDPSNAESLIRYTVEKGYHIHGWELGNELCGNGVGVRVSSPDYASDLISLNNLLKEVYEAHNKSKPLAIAPGGFFEENWFIDFVNRTGNNLEAMTHHIYNLGAGVDPGVVQRILSPSSLDGEKDTFRKLRDIVRNSGSSAVNWVGEAGGAYNSGRDHVSNAYMYSFWYLDQLGMSASFDTKTYCRQSLIGGNYGLLNTTNFFPNPDYYSALLWHRLMGRNVLSTSFTGSKYIRSYTHCSKSQEGITVLLINLSGNTTIYADVAFKGPLSVQQTYHQGHKSWMRGIKWLQRRRAEYHLSAKDGDLQSQTMLLNGEALSVDASGEIPPLAPIHVSALKPIRVKPYTIVFVQMPYIRLPACE